MLKLAEPKARYTTTRKMKGGFFGKLFKSSTPAAGPISPSQQGEQPVAVRASNVIKASAALTVVTTLGTMLSESLANPAALTAITGIASTSLAVASGGAVVVGIMVIAAAWFVIKEKKKAYNGLILVMDELYLVLQKLSGIVDVSMHIAETYGFPIDTRDVNIALNTILNKFDELLDPTTDYASIKQNLSDFRALKQKFNGQVNLVIEEVNNLEQSQDANATIDPPKLSLWTRVKSSSMVTSVSNFKKQVIDFSAPKFVEELNESVAYLALYVAALSASFSTTYTTVVVQLLVSGNKMDELKALQAKVLNDMKFHSMLEGALVYPLMQSQKTYKTCLNKNPAASCDPTFSKAAESMRTYMQSKFNQSDAGSVASVLYTKMPKLNEVVTSATNPISTADDANTFADAVKKAFDTDKNASLTSTTVVAPATPTNPPARNPQPPDGDIELMPIAPTAGVPIAAPATNVVAPATNVEAPATNVEAPAQTSQLTTGNP